MKKKRERPGIQSVEIASGILAVLARLAQPLQLKDLARQCAMPAAKVHRYLVSLTRTNLVAQDNVDGRYSVGPEAIALGLAGLHAVDVVRIASASLVELRDASGETAVLAIWNNTGPVIVRIEESSRPVFMNVRVGSMLPIMRSAVGRIFAAYLPAAAARRLIEAERRRRRGAPDRGNAPPIDDIVAATRRHEIAVVDGDLVPGVTALAAPIFDHRGRIVASIALLGGPEHLRASTNSEAASLLKRTAASISLRLGFSRSRRASHPDAPRLGSAVRVRKRSVPRRRPPAA
jgi:DNA-binding IclR family transcriptional regulator